MAFHTGHKTLFPRNSTVVKTQKCLEIVFNFTFFEGLVNTSLPLGKTFVSFNIGEYSALMYPIVVMRTKEKYWEVPDIMFEALYVERNRPGIANLSRPPPRIYRESIK